MPSDTTKKNVPEPTSAAVAPLQKLTAEKPLQCPRCQSMNTKFCYYNNYSHSQPRHFCKSCRRYWTQGGALRNVPVGGGVRKSSLKRRLRTTAPAPSSSHSPANSTSTSSPAEATSFLALPTLTHKPQPFSITTPVVTCQDHVQGSTEGGNGHCMGLGGFGYGFPESVLGFNDALRGTVWSFPSTAMSTMGFLDFAWGSSNGPNSNNNTTIWKLFPDVEVVGAGSLVDGVGDSFAWSDLAISTSGGTLK